jgi:serine/threonine protein kinase
LSKPYGKNVDLWSLGIIIYVTLCSMLPFDSNDNKEIARQTIYDPVLFDDDIWKNKSNEVKDLILSNIIMFLFLLELLEKDRFKRISIEEVLSHPWICNKNK